jgi:hypothetical protein
MLRAKKATVASANRFASFAYKHEPRREREAPFGLQADTASLLGEILKKDNTLKESVTGLMSQAKASGTMESYEHSTKKFLRSFALRTSTVIRCTRSKPSFILSYSWTRTRIDGDPVPGEAGIAVAGTAVRRGKHCLV